MQLLLTPAIIKTFSFCLSGYIRITEPEWMKTICVDEGFNL